MSFSADDLLGEDREEELLDVEPRREDAHGLVDAGVLLDRILGELLLGPPAFLIF